MKKQRKKNHINKKIFIVLAIITIIVFGVWYKWFRVTYDAQGIPNPLVSYEFVKSRPEAKLFYPNGKVYSPFGQPERRTDEGIGPAFAGAVITSQDPPEKIYRWHHDWLLKNGWHLDKNAFAGLLSTQLSLQGYSRGKRESFYVAIDNPKQLGWVLGKQAQQNKTIFEFRYEIE